MKKTLVALATLAVAGGAFAQTPTQRNLPDGSVQIFGVADAAITNITGSGAGSVTQMNGEGRNESSRIGFRGMEDMGGGWKASFWLEAGFNQDRGTGQTTNLANLGGGQAAVTTTTGTATSTISYLGSSAGGQQGLTFNRAATLSLIQKDLGELRVGRDYSASFWNWTAFDPFGTVGVGAATNIYIGALSKVNAVAPPGQPLPQVRTSNAISWFTNTYSGFRAQVQAALSEQPTNCVSTGVAVDAQAVDGNGCLGGAGDGKLFGIRVAYDSGPLSAAYSTTTAFYPMKDRTINRAGTAPGATATIGNGVGQYNGDFTSTSLALAYDFKVAKVSFVNAVQTFQGGQIATYALGNNDSAATITANQYNLGLASIITNGATAGGAYAAGTTSLTDRKLTTNLVGLTVPMGNLTLKGSYMTGKKTGGMTVNSTGKAAFDVADGATQTQVAVGAVYDLSKRTAVYGTYATLKATGINAQAHNGFAAAPNTGSNGESNLSSVDLGIRHRF